MFGRRTKKKIEELERANTALALHAVGLARLVAQKCLEQRLDVNLMRLVQDCTDKVMSGNWHEYVSGGGMVGPGRVKQEPAPAQPAGGPAREPTAAPEHEADVAAIFGEASA